MNRLTSFGAVLILSQLSTSVARCQDIRVEKLAEPAPTGEVSADITGLLDNTGVKVLKGASRTVCEIWLCKQWPVKSLTPPAEVFYPFVDGQLIGVIRLGRSMADFKDQDISSGIYTLRYCQMPRDGAHEGVAPTRDYLLLLSAEKDQSPAALAFNPLSESSMEAAESTHPGVLSLQKPDGNAAPAVRHDEEKDWWILHLQGKVETAGTVQDLGLDVVVAGVAEGL